MSLELAQSVISRQRSKRSLSDPGCQAKTNSGQRAAATIRQLAVGDQGGGVRSLYRFADFWLFDRCDRRH